MLVILLVLAASPARAYDPVDPSGTWEAPDNDVGQPSDTQDVASNKAGTTDKVLVLTPTGPDKIFSVEVYNAGSGEVLDTVEYTAGNTPPVTVPPGAKARVRDDADDGSAKPRGTSTFG
ncbi:MAG: hypothetical protein AB1726_09795 [Planctomycetota bacterium]